MELLIKAGSTDRSVDLRIVDSSDGTPETGVTSGSAGIAMWYRRDSGLKVPIAPLSTLSALTDAHSDGGILHISDGYYRVDIPDLAFAAGVDSVLIGGSITGMVVVGAKIQLAGYDPRTELTTAVLARIDTTLSTLQSAITTAISASQTVITNLLNSIAGSLRTRDSDETSDLLRFTRGDFISKALLDLGAITGYTKLWFTMKESEGQPDGDATVQIGVGSGFGTPGLLVLNGEPATAAQGTITIDDAASGDITIVLEAVAIAQLAPGRYYFDIQVLIGGEITTLTTGVVIVSADYTRAIS